MEMSSIQIYLEQLSRALTNPLGIMAIVCMAALTMLVIITDSARWYVVSMALFAIACSTPIAKYMSKIPFLGPLQFFRVWNRPLTFACLLMLAVGIMRFDRQNRSRLMPKSFWMFVAFQVFCALRMILVSNLFDRGAAALLMIGLMVFIATLVLAPGLQSLRDVSRLAWAITGSVLVFILAALLQYGSNPGSVEHLHRFFGMTANPQYAGVFLATSLPAMCYILVRRKQGLRIAMTVPVLATSIPVVVLMLIWTGSRGSAIVTLSGLIVFFHRRLGRFVLAGALCAVIGLLLAPYLSNAFGILDRFFNEANTRAQVWSQMLASIRRNPWFGYVPDTTNVYMGSTVGEGSYLMSLSLYGIVGTLPLMFCFGMVASEIRQLYSLRKVIPELADAIDLTTAFWAAIAVVGIFESFLLSFLTHSMLMIYLFFTLHGFLLDYARQAVEQRTNGFAAEEYDEQMAYGAPVLTS